MIFGDINIFAIQVVFEEKVNDIIYCHFCYWINNKKLGNDSMLTALNDIMLFYSWIINDVGNRVYDRDLEGVSDTEIYSSIRSRIFDDESEIYEGTPARFDITIRTESMLGNEVYYFEDDESSYIIYRHKDDIRSFKTKKGYADKVIVDSYQELKKYY